VPGKAAFATGDATHVGWRPEHLHFFDAATGKRRDDVDAQAAGTFGLVHNFA